MSFRAVEVTIGTAAIAIATATEKNTHEITLGNDYNKTIYVGGAAVAIGGGYSIHKNVPVTLKVGRDKVAIIYLFLA